GENGGANQGSTAADPSTGVMYVKTYDEPTIHRLTETVASHRLSTTRGTDEQRGYALYMQNCVACHGPDRTRIAFPQQMDFSHCAARVRAGKGEMPAFPETALSPPDINFLAAYLKNPELGQANEVSESSRIGAPSGQRRFYGQFGNIFRALNGLPAFGPPWSSLVAY